MYPRGRSILPNSTRSRMNSGTIAVTLSAHSCFGCQEHWRSLPIVPPNHPRVRLEQFPTRTSWFNCGLTSAGFVAPVCILHCLHERAVISLPLPFDYGSLGINLQSPVAGAM